MVATGGTHKFIIAELSRTDYESGSGYEGGYYSHDSYFEVDDKEEGEPCPGEAFYAEDGSDASEFVRKLLRAVDLTSCEDSGVVLASEDEVTEMWGEGDSGSVEYTGNEGATRETTCVLLHCLAYTHLRMCPCWND